MSRLYTRRERADFVVFMLHPACVLFAAIAAVTVVVRWVVG